MSTGFDPYENSYFAHLEVDEILLKERDLMRQLSNSFLRIAPHRIQDLSDVLHRNVVDSAEEIVAVRTIDSFTFLQDFVNGLIPVDRTVDFQIMVKDPGWYYMTPYYQNEVYAREKYSGLKENQSDSLKEVVTVNNRIYGDIGFKSAFARNILPNLSESWNEEMRSHVMEVEGEDEDYALISEQILEMLQYDIEKLFASDARDLTAARILSRQFHRFPCDALKITLQSLPENMRDQALALMEHALYARSGLVLGFNKGIFEIAEDIASNASAAYASSPIHINNEIAVKLNSVDLMNIKSVITAIEPYGYFEYDLLEHFHLL